MTTIAILGLGEAGRLYARGLRGAGADVRSYDPFHSADHPEIAQVAGLAVAVGGAEVVISLVGARGSVALAAEAMPLLGPAAVYADLNTAAPETKSEIAALAAERGIEMADVAVLAPVPRAAHRTQLLASGDGAARLAELLSPYGVPIDVVAGVAGEAARLRLLRSIFMKGLAALVIEGLSAARVAGAESWLREQITQELGPDGPALVERLVTGTYQHAERREHEVRDALAALDASGQPADMTRATLAWFERIVADRDASGA